MRVIRRGSSALALAFALFSSAYASQAEAAPSGPLTDAVANQNAAVSQALSPWDAQLYGAAFAQARRGDHDAAAATLATINDKSLAGHIEYLRIMDSGGPKVSYAELCAWLDAYGDHPGADRVYKLAEKRKPADAIAPRAPLGGLGSQLWRKIEAVARTLNPGSGEAYRPYRPTPESREAREAFYGGDVHTARLLAQATGERWVAGLAAFRMGDYVDALRRFEIVARDENENAWMRSGAAYWASRSAIAAGAPELSPDFLRMAARAPHTFYGLLAERQLGLKSEVSGEDAPDPLQQIAQANSGFQLASGPGPDPFATARLTKADPRAKRAMALSQIGMAAEAGQELRIGLLDAKTDAERRQWTTLAMSLNAPIVSNADTRRVRGVNPGDYPTPRLTPRGGFTVDKALVYAVVRQESRFKENAVSPVGARGLMQVMPATAAFVTGDDRLKSDIGLLTEPSTNLRVGQDYLQRLLNNLSPQGDILRAVAAYNGGPGAVSKAVTASGTDSDPLMLIESLPAQETRDYVEKVVAGYWIYRRIFGKESETLDLVASGARSADIRQDR